MFQWRHQIFSSTILFFKSFFNGFAIFLKSCVFFHIVVEQCACILFIFIFSLFINRQIFISCSYDSLSITAVKVLNENLKEKKKKLFWYLEGKTLRGETTFLFYWSGHPKQLQVSCYVFNAEEPLPLRKTRIKSVGEEEAEEGKGGRGVSAQKSMTGGIRREKKKLP